jgi:ABC-type polysaccharide/polyol phosphate export permease
MASEGLPSEPITLPGMVDRTQQRSTVGGMISAVTSYRELVKNLVLRDLRLKYRGSVLGFVWSLANPLAMVTIYTLAFTYILRTSIPGFVFFLLLSLLAWSFFANSATMATGAFVDGGGLMKSVVFPRAILPIAAVLFNLAQYLLTFIVLFPVMLAVYRPPLAAPMLAFPVLLSLQVVFTLGVALLLAVSTAFFRDTRHLLELALALLFWLTPVVYPLSQVDERFRAVVRFSPLSPFLVGYQEMFFYGRWPETSTWVAAIGYAAVALIAGAWTFLAVDDELAEQV